MTRNASVSKKLHLTFDYELFFSKSGTPEKCLIEPTAKLLSIVKTHGIKATFFIDVLYYIRTLEIAQTRDQALRIRRQLQEIVAQGCRIELHLHPHWLDASFVHGQWAFPVYHKFRLQNLPPQKITDLFVSGTQVLEEIAREVDSSYKLLAFRAGGFCVQPFDVLKNGFIKSGIIIDSSVAPGMAGSSKTHAFDFQMAPTSSCYRFSDDPLIRVTNGEFIELPITTYRKSFFSKLCVKIDKQTNKRRYRIIGDGTGLYFPIPVWKKLLPATRMLTLDGEMRPSELAAEIASATQPVITVISHPKSLSPISFECLDRLIASSCCFVDLLDAAELKRTMISNG